MTVKEYMDKLQRELPELPWIMVDRIVEQYGVSQRDVETLLGLDEYHAEGVKYYEEVVQGDSKLGKRALNWSVWLTRVRSKAHRNPGLYMIFWAYLTR
jgi:Asp-tRNA(Asn)/Glu-tRNA(Gln) amidotransferase B subunit